MSAGYPIGVRSLCEFTARSGDLSARFTPAPTAQQGMAGHRIAAARRGAGYQREISLLGTCQGLTVRGRADGYDAAHNVLEEFKTHRGDLSRMPANQRGLHWAQLKIYGALLCGERSLTEVDLSLVYVDVNSEAETVLTERFSAAELRGYFEELCRRFSGWARRERQHRRRRDRFLTALPFPHAGLRLGQRQLAEAVYRAAMGGRALLIQAPTGIGKTIGTLFPLLKALPTKAMDKVFFLTAKTPAQRTAMQALEGLLSADARPLRVLELVAKHTACHFPGRACEAASCPLARGFYDRLGAARERALESATLDRETVRRAALSHEVCPYYLAQELVRWCDVIVADYNYYFDTSAILHALALQNQWRVGVLVDEAHNLLPRGRDMYSSTLNSATLVSAAAGASLAIKSRLDPLRRSWCAIHRMQGEDYAVYPTIPVEFLAALQQATGVIADELAADPVQSSVSLLEFYFAALHFCRMAAEFGGHSLFDVTLSAADSTLCIRNVDPGRFLRVRFASSATSVLFSATLGPGEYYRQLLGLPQDAAWVNVGSPFAAAQLEVRIESGISTRYRDRPRSLGPIADLLARQYRARPGNYLAFFSSFDYLHAVCRHFRERMPAVPAWEQVRAMGREARDEFLARFTPEGRGIGFAVLGGAFAEGIDLPGERLIGAFIATLGLPQINPVNAQIERRLELLFGSGYEYTYLYPGLQKVVQAAGRIIRTPADRGTLYLIDDRYTGAQVRRLLPDWWRVQSN